MALMATAVYAAATIDELDTWSNDNEAIANRWDRSCTFTPADGSGAVGELVVGTTF